MKNSNIYRVMFRVSGDEANKKCIRFVAIMKYRFESIEVQLCNNMFISIDRKIRDYNL